MRDVQRAVASSNIRRALMGMARCAALFLISEAAMATDAFRINVGGPAYIDVNGNLWSADAGYNTGVPNDFGSIAISGTSDPQLFRTERWDEPTAPELEYSVNVPNATYVVRLHFAENYMGMPGDRIFHVDMEGVRQFSNIDLYAEAGRHVVVTKTAQIVVSDGQLNIRFVHDVENPMINAIEIIGTDDAQSPTSPANLGAITISNSQIDLSWDAADDNVAVTGYQIERCEGVDCTNFAYVGHTNSTRYSDKGLSSLTSYSYRVRANDAVFNYGNYSGVSSAATQSDVGTAIRINAGGGAYTSLDGTVWAPDTQFNTGETSDFGPIEVAGTSDPELFRDERWDGPSAPELQYAFDVPNGSYLVQLHFAENYGGILGPGERKFHVDIEGTRRFSNIDPYAEAGPHVAIKKSALVNVVDGQINIAFVHEVENPIIDAIEIIQRTDILAPTNPTNFTAIAVSNSQVNLNWSASADNVAVTGYEIERCAGIGCSNFQVIGNSSTNHFADLGASPATNYTYRLRAYDAFFNYGLYSTAERVATPTSSSPILSVTIHPTDVVLNWGASPDAVAYEIERCEGDECSFVWLAEVGYPLTTFIDSTVTLGTTYTYRVRARGSGGNYEEWTTSGAAVAGFCD